MPEQPISANFRKFSAAIPELPYLIFWGLVYAIGMHPDAPWGDSLGYAIAIRKGFDLAGNANSHFAYLNFHALVLKVFGFSDGLSLLGFASVFWACLALWLTSTISRLVSGSREAGILSMQVLASCFAFWRLASIPEVYTMELAFFAACLWYVLRWCKLGGEANFYGFAFFHALGLLVHIHLILLFPVYIWILFFFKRKIPLAALVFYLIPAFVLWFSVDVLQLNSWSQVLFESQQNQLLSFSLLRLLKGPFFVAGLLVFMLPAIFLLPFSKVKFLDSGRWIRPEFQVLILLVITFSGFASLYPDPGIFVFLLPIFLLISLAAGSLASKTGSFFWLRWALPAFQSGFYLLLFAGLQLFSPPDWRNSQQIKGGLGFISLPWARGNVASVRDKIRELSPDSIPEGLQWNVRQSQTWDSLSSANHQPD